MTNTVIHGQALEKQPAPNLSGRIPELDGLRGLAIGMVLIFHYFQLTLVARPGSLLAYLQAAARLSWSGVDLFFVLSGFLIGGILLDARKATNYFQIFYTRRFFRIVPVYAALLLVIAVMNFTVERIHYSGLTWLTHDALPWYSFWTFTQNFWMAHSVTWGASALAVTWSLAIEEQFYLTLPVIVRFFSGRRLLVCVLAGICLAPLVRMAIRLIWPHNWVASFVLMPCRADALLLGVLAAILIRDDAWRARIQRSNRFFTVSTLVFLSGIAFLTLKSPTIARPLMQSFGYTWLALFYATVLLFTVTRPQSVISRGLRIKWIGWLGGIAYGTYLLHELLLGTLFGYFWGHEPRITGGYTSLTSLVALVLTLVIARLSWRYFENPLIRFGHRSSYAFAESSSPKALPQSVAETVCP
jgi:peptidoglycan/LPS O-acetylase OafA/YrhL